MPKAYASEFKELPDQPGFWVDDFLTSYGISVVQHTDGKLYALGWAEHPTPVDELRRVPAGGRSSTREDTDKNFKQAGWYGPCPVPAARRYEIRKLKDRFVRLGPDDV